MTITAENIVKNYLTAVRRAIDPHSSLLAASTPYIVAGSIGSADRHAIIAGTQAAQTADADYIHLEFEPGAEREGPVNVMIGMVRLGVMHVRESCRFWLREDGRMALVATVGSKAATMTFNADGTDSTPSLPEGDIQAGYDRAAVRLLELAAIPTSHSQTVTIRMLRAA